MRQIKLWSIALTTCFIPVGSIAIPPTQLNSIILAQTERSPTQFNLSGKWVIKTQNYRVGEDNITCITEPNTELTIEPILTQNGNQIDADPMTLIINEGSISGNSVYLRGEIFSLKGTISNDGNQITGTFTCSPLTQPFTMTRKSVQQSGNAPQQPIQAPSDNQPQNSNPSEMLW
ncbi:hypothetical protein [Argonema antarcticum]|uniref:hypothetical protein n=1 Tax=Argonema antarcticum TaxID=2942763 RepID=UPI0020126F7E|nr:hypothetical protein [Argonema antarcticum]MCL1471950.1 hypothetical protein [Argonema antarcticum A004/B2]